MKKLWLKTILLAIIVFATTLVADIAVSRHFRPNNWAYAWNDVYDNNVNSDLVILGSSRALLHFDAQLVQDSLELSTYNLGISNAHVELAYFRLLELLKNCSKKPKFITLEVGYLTLWTANTFTDHQQLFPFMLFNRDCYQCAKHLEGYDAAYFVVPLIRYGGYWSKCHTNSLSHKNKKLNKGSTFFPDKKFDIGLFNQRQKNNFEETFTIDPLRISFLDKLVRTCNDNDIKINFVYTPEFYPGRRFFKNRDEVLAFFHNYADSLKIPFADFSNEVEFNSDTSNFYNVQHLCKKGAEKFTSEMYVPWIKELYGL